MSAQHFSIFPAQIRGQRCCFWVQAVPHSLKDHAPCGTIGLRVYVRGLAEKTLDLHGQWFVCGQNLRHKTVFIHVALEGAFVQTAFGAERGVEAWRLYADGFTQLCHSDIVVAAPVEHFHRDIERTLDIECTRSAAASRLFQSYFFISH